MRVLRYAGLVGRAAMAAGPAHFFAHTAYSVFVAYGHKNRLRWGGRPGAL